MREVQIAKNSDISPPAFQAENLGVPDPIIGKKFKEWQVDVIVAVVAHS